MKTGGPHSCCVLTLAFAALLGFSSLGLGFWILFKLVPHHVHRSSNGVPHRSVVPNLSKIGSSFRVHMDPQEPEIVEIEPSTIKPAPMDTECHFYNCVDVYRCGQDGTGRLTVYVYPKQRFAYAGRREKLITAESSAEFEKIIAAIRKSQYFEADPSRACLLVPYLDTLNSRKLDSHALGQILTSLPYWNGGQNHLLFSMSSWHDRDSMASGKAILASAGASTDIFRRSFDVSIPAFNPLLAGGSTADGDAWSNRPRSRLLLSASLSRSPDNEGSLRILSAKQPKSPSMILVVSGCKQQLDYHRRCGDEDSGVYNYSQLLSTSEFCLLFGNVNSFAFELFDALKHGCVPVIVDRKVILPFQEILDWRRASVEVYRHELTEIVSVLEAMPQEYIRRLRAIGMDFWQKYMSSMEAIVLTTLRVLEKRLFPYKGPLYHDWNSQDAASRRPPIFLPRIVPSDGFTAVILTYDRVASLFKAIEQLTNVTNLVKVIVVWNNLHQDPPLNSMWPKITQPIRIIRSKSNKLSNRFYPYDEIETEAVLSLDDDITMLTADEIDFGYQVWRENPGHIVGYPSRLHLWDNVTASYKYDSEWRNEMSMVLTGAAFYHKYYNHLYTHVMPKELRDIVDERMNCEDIAMNFLIANYTGLHGIKVTPRKKFKCPSCAAVDVLMDSGHMNERSDCIRRFSDIFNGIPLKTVEFRADPVLFKSDVPMALADFPNIGQL